MRLRNIFLAIFCLFAHASPASASKVLQPPDTSSPYAMLNAFEQSALELRDAVLKYQKTRTLQDMRAMAAVAGRIVRLFDLDLAKD